MCSIFLNLFIYLFICHDGMQPGSYVWPFRKTDKMFRERKSEQHRSHAFLPHEQVQNAKIECGTAVSSAANSKSNSLLNDALPQYCRPLAATGASREGSFVERTNRHGCTRSSEVGDQGGEL
jgi:hypothetical protein